uniref:Uncharacterized protein n=1 Tax=Parascaris univalens TaxID=6257 RepID=A0A915BQ66_PARUN
TMHDMHSLVFKISHLAYDQQFQHKRFTQNRFLKHSRLEGP